MYKEKLVECGVPEHDIFFPTAEEATTNTLAEAKGAIPFIERRLGRTAKRIILCSRAVHQRRTWATFRRQHPGITYINRPGFEMLSVELLPRIVQEVDRLREYGAKGDLEPQEIPEEVSEICEQIRAVFPG